MFKQLNKYWYLFVTLGLFLFNCSTIPNKVDTSRPDWIIGESKINQTTDEINFVGISHPSENLDEARYNAMLNAGRTVVSYLNWNIDAYKEISLRKGVCVEFDELDSIFLDSSVHGALQVMSKIKLNEEYVEKESDKSKNHVVFVNVLIKKRDLNALRLSMVEESARSIEGRFEESEFLAQQRKRAAEAFRESGVVELNKIKAGTFDDYVEWRKCKRTLQDRKQAALDQATKAMNEAAKQLELDSAEFFEEMSKDGFSD
jgi:hypothetical protein